MSAKIGILFDLDGTLIHVPENFFEVLDKIIRDVIFTLTNKEVSKEELYAFWRSGRKFDDFLRNWEILDTEDFWKRFDEQDLEERKKMIERGEIFLFKDAENLLNDLKNDENLLLGIISNTPASIANIELELINLPYNEIFTEIYLLGTELQHKAKPQPDSILEFMKKYQISNKKMYIIGDTDLDIKAGQNADINSVLIMRKHNKTIKSMKNVKPDFIIRNMIDVKKIIY